VQIEKVEEAPSATEELPEKEQPARPAVTVQE